MMLKQKKLYLLFFVTALESMKNKVVDEKKSADMEVI